MNDVTSAADLFSLERRVAIITGGATGIGLDTARVLASAGATVVIAGLPGDRPEEVAAALREEGLTIFGVVCDVTDKQHLTNLVDSTMERWGRLDVVFANAGVALDEGPHTTGTDDQLDRMFDIHVRSVITLANLAIPYMVANEAGGSFIIMSSLSAVRGNSLLGQYGVTKAANAQLARNLAVQWGPQNIRVNALAPGVIRTEFAEPLTGNKDVADRRLAKTPMRRFGETYHVAGTVLWLASMAGSFTSGQTIIIDGGTVISD